MTNVVIPNGISYGILFQDRDDKPHLLIRSADQSHDKSALNTTVRAL